MNFYLFRKPAFFNFFAFFAFLAPFSLLFSGEAPKPTNKELYAIHHIGQVIDVLRSEAADTIWPGMRLQAPALVTFQSGHILAFHLNSEDPVWRKLSVNGQNALFSDSDKWNALESPLNQAFPIEKQEAYVFAFEAFEQDPFLPFLAFVHERFHKHQFTYFSEDPHAVNDISYEDHLNSDNLALMKMEEALLIDYLEALKKKQPLSVRERLLKRFTAINTIRMRLLSDNSQKWERLHQQMEGMADYVSIRLLDIHPILPKFDALDHLQRLLQNYREDPRIVEGAIQWRHYGVGAVLGYALDDLMVADWKLAVEQRGKGLSLLLAEKWSLSELEIQQLAHAVKQEYGYVEAKGALEKQLADYRRNIAYFDQKFTETEGVVVSISKPPGTELNGGGSVAHTFQLSNGLSLSLFCSSTAIVQDNSWKLAFERIPLLFQNRAGDQKFKLENKLMLQIDGKEVSLDSIIKDGVERGFESLSWKDQFSMFHSEGHPGVISGKGGKLSISFQAVR